MGATKIVETSEKRHLMPPATSPEARENELIALAYNLVEKRLREGTATSQETVHFLKMGSIRQREELEKLRRENELLKAKTDSIQASQTTEEMYRAAIAAMQSYRPTEEVDIVDPFLC